MIDVNMVPVTVFGANGQSLPDRGIRMEQFVDAQCAIGYDFQLDLRSLGIDYDSTTDEVDLVCQTNGDSISLTRVGDYFRWTVQPDDLRGPGIAPGGTQTVECQVVHTRTTSLDPVTNQPKRVATDFFDVKIERRSGFTPDKIANLVAWYDAYDFIASASGTAVSQWNDKSAYKRHLYQAVGANQPTVNFDGAGRPFVLFDGTNDALETTWAQFGLASSLVCAFQADVIDATVRGVVQVGGTNGARLAFVTANLKGESGADVANTTVPVVDTTVVGTVTKVASGAIAAQLSTSQAALGAIVSQASTNAVTPGTIGVGDTAADSPAALRVMELAVFSSVVSAADLARLQRAMLMKWTGQ